MLLWAIVIGLVAAVALLAFIVDRTDKNTVATINRNASAINAQLARINDLEWRIEALERDRDALLKERKDWNY